VAVALLALVGLLAVDLVRARFDEDLACMRLTLLFILPSLQSGEFIRGFKAQFARRMGGSIPPGLYFYGRPVGCTRVLNIIAVAD
jgi:hypothetical protein